MTMIQYVYLYLLTVPVFFIIDMVWLGLVARNFYQSQIGHLLGTVQWAPAVLFYLFYIVGILVFAVVPALQQGSYMTALLLGAFFGALAYATYDLTNLSTLKDWPLLISLVDIAWGTVLTGSVATASYFIGRALFF